MKLHKRFLALFTAAVIACTPVAASAANFADMHNIPWAGAETAINKAADLGLMVGSQENGRTYFRPKDSVSLCEIAQLSYKLLQNTGKINGADASVVDRWVPAMQQVKLPTWTHTAVAYCLEMNIVSTADLANFIRGGVTAPANREQAAAMLGRALAVATPSLAGTATTTFNDDYQISTSAKPYVALLVKQGVVKGDTNGNFNPKNTLNRTETAVMVTNLHGVLMNTATTTAPLHTSKTVSGTLSAADYRYVALKGDSNYYYFGASTTLTKDRQNSSISELITAFQRNLVKDVTMSVSGDNYIHNITYTTKSNETIVKGTVKSLSNTTIKIDSKTYDIRDYEDVTVKLDGSSKNFSKLKNAVKDSASTVTASITLDYNGYVTKIDARTKSSTSESTGTVNYLSTSKIEIGSKTYHIDDYDDITIKIDGSTKSFKNLRSMYEDPNVSLKATVTYDADKYVQKLVVTSTDLNSHIYQGNVKSISKSSIKLDGTTYSIESNPYVSVNIYESGRLSDRATSISSLVHYADGMGGFEAQIEVRGGKVMSIEGNMDVYGHESFSGSVRSFSKSSMKIGSQSYSIDSSADVNVTVTGGKTNTRARDLSTLLEFKDANWIDFHVSVEVHGGKITSISGTMELPAYEEPEDEYVEGNVSKLTSSSIKIGGKTYDISSSTDMYVYIWNDAMGTYEETTSLNTIRQMYNFSKSFYAEAVVSMGEVTYLLGEMRIDMEVYG